MQHEYFSPCSLGLEEALIQELTSLNASGIKKKPGGVIFFGDNTLGYRANLWLRTAIRVQRLVTRQHTIRNPEDLYQAVDRVDWSRYLNLDQTLAIDASVRDNPEIRHSKFAALKAKDAIVDQFRKRTGRRPNIDTSRPDLPLKLVVQRDEVSVYLNMSGPSLHKRGWRPVQVKSPLNESIAAGLLILTGWDCRSPLVDPMCGSGTFLIEAAHMALRRAPGLERPFPFTRWSDFRHDLWQSIYQDAKDQQRQTLDFTLFGGDRHPGALGIAESSARNAGVLSHLRLQHRDLDHYSPAGEPQLALVNPPYGARLGEGEDLVESWRALGQFFRRELAGKKAFVLSGEQELTRHLRLRATRRHPVKNGPIDCRWLEYQLLAARTSTRVSAPVTDSPPDSPRK